MFIALFHLVSSSAVHWRWSRGGLRAKMIEWLSVLSCIGTEEKNNNLFCIWTSSIHIFLRLWEGGRSFPVPESITRIPLMCPETFPGDHSSDWLTTGKYLWMKIFVNDDLWSRWWRGNWRRKNCSCALKFVSLKIGNWWISLLGTGCHAIDASRRMRLVFFNIYQQVISPNI